MGLKKIGEEQLHAIGEYRRKSKMKTVMTLVNPIGIIH